MLRLLILIQKKVSICSGLYTFSMTLSTKSIKANLDQIIFFRGSVAPRKCSFDTHCSHDCNFCSIVKQDLEEMRIAKQWWDEEYPGKSITQYSSVSQYNV